MKYFHRTESNCRHSTRFFFYKQCFFFSAQADVLLKYNSNLLKYGRTLPDKMVFKMLFEMSMIMLHMSQGLIRNIFRDSSFN